MMPSSSVIFPRALEPLLLRDIPLWRHTSVRAGGRAWFYAAPERAEDAAALLQAAQQARLPVVCLGGGTNTLFADTVYHGLVLDTKNLGGIAHRDESLTAASGESLAAVVTFACNAGLTGLEWAAGIPGTIGGAAAMNSGAQGGDMAAVVTGLRIADQGRVDWVEVSDLGYGYRTSAIKDGRLRGLILEVRVRLRRGDAAECGERVAAGLRDRSRRLPPGATFGSVFCNPSVGPTAGQLLDRADCKTLRVGKARVSSEHANILVNEGSDNAVEILELMRQMRARVHAEFGIDLQEEVVVISSESPERVNG